MELISKDYSPEYEEELYNRIAEESANKTRLEKKLSQEKKKAEKDAQKTAKTNLNNELQLVEREARRQLDTEITLQKEESHTRVLGKAVLSDAAANRATFNQSATNLLVNFQGIISENLL